MYIGLLFEVLGTIIGIMVYTLSYFVFVNNEDDCIDGVRERSTEKVKDSSAVILSLYICIHP